MTKKRLHGYLLSGLLFCIASVASLVASTVVNANEVEIVNVKATQSSDKTWRFAVTLKHKDEGWDHYANEWQIIAPDNKILGTRTLYHPHVNEQPFTRSLDGVKIPAELETVRIIAKDTVHGLSTKAVRFNLSTQKVEQIKLELKKTKY